MGHDPISTSFTGRDFTLSYGHHVYFKILDKPDSVLDDHLSQDIPQVELQGYSWPLGFPQPAMPLALALGFAV